MNALRNKVSLIGEYWLDESMIAGINAYSLSVTGKKPPPLYGA
jgi:hypothetical protein